MSRRIRVLLLAEACNPAWTSTPLQAFMWFKHLREVADVTLVTQVRNSDGFVDALGSVPERVHFINTESIAAPLHVIGARLTGSRSGVAIGTLASIPAYYYFEWLVWRQFRHMLLAGAFDLVHRLTPSTPVVPSWLATQSPVPFVLGPLIGSLPWPHGQDDLRRAEGGWPARFHSTARLLPYWRQTYTRAAAVLLASAHSSSLLRRVCREKLVFLPWNGVDVAACRPAKAATAHPELRLLFVGRMIPLKQPALILEALAASGVPAAGVHVTFVGCGPDETHVRETAEKRGLTAQVEMKGWIAHQELPVLYQQADLLVLPSVHESGGAVLLEAMACGLPCAVVDYGGPAEYVNADVGFRVGLGTYDDMVCGFARLFKRAYQERGLLRAMGDRCRDYALKHFDWRVKVQRLLGIYERIVRRSRRSGHDGRGKGRP